MGRVDGEVGVVPLREDLSPPQRGVRGLVELVPLPAGVTPVEQPPGSVERGLPLPF